jgi:hypothetical protein
VLLLVIPLYSWVESKDSSIRCPFGVIGSDDVLIVTLAFVPILRLPASFKRSKGLSQWERPDFDMAQRPSANCAVQITTHCTLASCVNCEEEEILVVWASAAAPNVTATGARAQTSSWSPSCPLSLSPLEVEAGTLDLHRS